MLPYIIRRLLATIPVLVVVGLFTFFLLRFTPGDPAAVMAGNEATQEEYLEIKEKARTRRPDTRTAWQVDGPDTARRLRDIH